MAQIPWIDDAQSIVLRTAPGAAGTSLLESARRTVARVAPATAVQQTTTMRRVVDTSVGPARQVVSLLSLLTGLALILGSVGVYRFRPGMSRRQKPDRLLADREDDIDRTPAILGSQPLAELVYISGNDVGTSCSTGRISVAAFANLASMNAWTLGFSTFLSTFGLALAASLIRTRLPEAHLGKETQDVVRLGMGLVATMTALLLGLVTASAKSIFDESGATVRGAAVTFLTLDRNLARYGPETASIRQALKDMLAFRIERTWPQSGERGTGVTEALAPEVVEAISARILVLSPDDESRRWLKSEALRQSEELLRSRWRVLEAGGNLPRPFLIAVILWLSATFASFGLYAPRNGTAVGVLGVAALSVAAAVFFIVELDGPFDGWITVSSEPLRFALANLAK